MSDLDHEPPLDGGQPEVETPEAEAPEPEAPPEVIEQARKYGWKAPDEWQGKAPPKGFMRPDEYLETPGVQNRILRDEMAELRKAQEERDRATADKLARMDRMYEEAARRREEAHKRELEGIRQAQRKAVEAGDTEEFDALEKKREQLGPVPQEAPRQDGKKADAEVEHIQKWVGSLPGDHWWKQDAVLRQVSGALYDEAGAKGVIGADAKIAYVERRIREEMPHKFPQGQKQRPARVDGGGLGLGGRQSLAEKLPPEAKQAAKGFIADGLFKDVEEYAKAYFQDENV